MAVGTVTQNKWARRLKMNGELWMIWRNHNRPDDRSDNRPNNALKGTDVIKITAIIGAEFTIASLMVFFVILWGLAR